MATRHKEFASLCRKVMAMKNKVQEKQGGKERSRDPAENAAAAETEVGVEEDTEMEQGQGLAQVG